MIALRAGQLHPYRLRFAQPLRGRFPHRAGWLLRLEDREGRCGWGDAAPWPGFGASAEEVEAALRLSLQRLVGLRFSGLEQLEAWLRAAALPGPAGYAVELAILDLLGQQSGATVPSMLGDGDRQQVASHVLVADAGEAAQAVADGARHLKLKLDRADPVPLVAAVRAAVGWQVALRLDVNAGWSLADARRHVPALEHLCPDWLEQPVAALADLARLRRETCIPIAADESLAREGFDDVLAAADVLVLKPMFLGGLLAARRLAARGLAAGKRVVLTHALESAVGRCGTLQLAAALSGLEVGGLAGGPAEDICPSPVLRAGTLRVPAGPGLGITPARPVTATRMPAQPTPLREWRRPPDPYALPHPLRSTALARPELVLARVGGSAWTAPQLLERTACLAAGLARQGLRPGACVAVPVVEQPELAADWLVAFFAVGWLGASVAPLALDPGGWQQGLESLAPDALLCCGVAPPQLVAACTARGLSLLRPEADSPPLPERFWPLAEERLRLLSSGSSARPHAVRLSTAQLAFSAFGSCIRIGHQPDDTWLACLPMHHVGGLSIVLRCAFYGIGLRWLPRFDPAAVAETLDSGEISLVSLVPTMLQRVLDARPARPFPARLRAVLLGGAAAPGPLLERCRNLQLPVLPTWGMSESASQLATLAVGQSARPREVGAPLAFARVSAYGGRLHAAGPLVAGGLLSGDLGQVSPSGQVHVSGRAGRSLTSGGETFSLAGVEEVFRVHPAVVDCAAVALPDPDWGQRLALAVVPAPACPSDAALLAWASDRLPACQLPKELRRTARLPRSPLGKLLQPALSDLFRPAVTPEETS